MASGFGEIMILRLAGQRRRVERLELFLRVREALVQMLDDLRLVGQLAQLGRLFARAEVGALCAERARNECCSLRTPPASADHFTAATERRLFM